MNQQLTSADGDNEQTISTQYRVMKTKMNKKEHATGGELDRQLDQVFLTSSNRMGPWQSTPEEKETKKIEETNLNLGLVNVNGETFYFKRVKRSYFFLHQIPDQKMQKEKAE